MKARPRDSIEQASPFDLNKLHVLTHECLDAALDEAESKHSKLAGDLKPAKKIRPLLFSNLQNTPQQRLSKLIDISKQQNKIFPVYLVLSVLLGGSLDELKNNPDILAAVRIFLKFKIEGNQYISEYGKNNACLHDALRCKSLSTTLISLLLMNGADPSQIDETHDRNTILHEAVIRLSIDKVKVLLDYGANPDVHNMDHCKPIDVAVEGLMVINDSESENFKKMIIIIILLLWCSLSLSPSPNEKLLPSHIVNFLLNLDIVTPGYREIICRSIFCFNYNFSLPFTEEELVTELENKLHVISRDDISIGDEIDDGGSAKVYKGCINGMQDVAIKLCKVAGLNCMRREAIIHAELKHLNIIEYFGVLEKNNSFGIVLEFARGGTLDSFINNNDKNVISNNFYSFVKQMNAGLGYIHSCGYVHLDFKPKNILLSEARVTPETRIWIADLGSCALQGEVRSFPVTTVTYCPPERFNLANPYLPANDIFSFGIIMGRMDTGAYPWSYEISDSTIESEVTKGHLPKFDKEVVSPKINTLMQWCCQMLPEKRPDCAAIADYVERNFKI